MRALLFIFSFFCITANAEHFGEVRSGELMLSSNSGYEAAVRLATEITFDITGMVAHVRLKQRFHNPSNDFVEGVYVFPLPEDAAVNSLEVLLGDRRIIGAIKEKAEAKRIYEKAKVEGRKASLVTQSRPNLFQNRVANIPPQSVIEVELTLVQPVTYDNREFSLRFPLTMTPRYIPGLPLYKKVNFREGWGMPTSQVSDAHLITPWQGATQRHELKVTGEIKPGMRLDGYGSTSHRVETRLVGDKLRFELNADALSYRDFVVYWKPERSELPTAAFFSETIAGEAFGLLMVMPPDVESLGIRDQNLPREMTFVIDTSGSMGGTSIEQAKQSLLFALAELSDADTFNIVEFNSVTRPLFRQPQEANQMTVLRAQEFVRKLNAGGGTEMLPALKFALSASPSERLRQIVFITDGAVGNEAELFKLIFENLGDARLFTVGIGSAPNGYFMRTASEFGRGTYTHVSTLHEVSVKMSSLLAKLSNPVARDIEVDWPDDWQVFPKHAADLYKGEPLMVAVKEGSKATQLKVRGTTARRSWEQTLTLGSSADGVGIATLWARSKLKSILDQKHRGVGESDIRSEALQLALTHKILSPYTSFVAVEEYVTRPVGNELITRAVTSPVPDGQTSRVMMPQTNSGWWLFVLIGCLLSSLSWLGSRVL